MVICCTPQMYSRIEVPWTGQCTEERDGMKMGRAGGVEVVNVDVNVNVNVNVNVINVNVNVSSTQATLAAD